MGHLLEVIGLTTSFSDDSGSVEVVSDVSFSVDEEEILCVVGESGCGKSVTLLSMMGLLKGTGGTVRGKALFEGQDLLAMSEKDLDSVRGYRLTMVFQDALTSLNPVLSIGNQMTEGIRIHLKLPAPAARERAISMLERTGLPDAASVMRKYPHTLSGGMRQRVMIAMAIACGARLLVADEPTTALDVTIQAQIMRLLKDLREEMGMSVILVTHDLGLVAEMADRVLVMYAGQVVEEAEVHTLFKSPRHPYTRALMKSIPDLRNAGRKRLLSIGGRVPERYEDIVGCRFYSRCGISVPECAVNPQVLTPVGQGHTVRCQVEAGRHDP